MKRHVDGTVCKEGTQSLPPGFTPCCKIFGAHTATCEYDLRYEWWPGQRFWVVALGESVGSGGVWIGTCPHCGSQLTPASSRPTEEEDEGGDPGRWLQL